MLACFAGATRASVLGKEKPKVLPLSSILLKIIEPPWAKMTFLAM